MRRGAGERVLPLGFKVKDALPLCCTPPCHLHPFITPCCFPRAQTDHGAGSSFQGGVTFVTSDLRVAKGVRAGPTLISLMRLPFGPLVPLPDADWQLAGSLAGLGGGRGFLCPPPIPLGLLWVPDSACPVVVFDGGGLWVWSPPASASGQGETLLSAPQQLQPLSSHLTPRPGPLLLGWVTPTPQSPSPQWHPPIR